MSAVDGFVFNGFAFEIEVDEFPVPQVITVEVTTANGATSQFAQYVGNGSDGRPFNNDRAHFFPLIDAGAGFTDIVSIRVFDSGRLFRIDNLAYDVTAAVPMPTAALLAGVGIAGVFCVRRGR